MLQKVYFKRKDLSRTSKCELNLHLVVHLLKKKKNLLFSKRQTAINCILYYNLLAKEPTYKT